MFAGLTEECPLTKERSYKHRIYTYCGNGLKFIVVCFVALTVAITTMLVLQILYTENIPQVCTYNYETVQTQNIKNILCCKYYNSVYYH